MVNRLGREVGQKHRDYRRIYHNQTAQRRQRLKLKWWQLECGRTGCRGLESGLQFGRNCVLNVQIGISIWYTCNLLILKRIRTSFLSQVEKNIFQKAVVLIIFSDQFDYIYFIWLYLWLCLLAESKPYRWGKEKGSLNPPNPFSQK